MAAVIPLLPSTNTGHHTQEEGVAMVTIEEPQNVNQTMNQTGLVVIDVSFQSRCLCRLLSIAPVVKQPCVTFQTAWLLCDAYLSLWDHRLPFRVANISRDERKTGPLLFL